MPPSTRFPKQTGVFVRSARAKRSAAGLIAVILFAACSGDGSGSSGSSTPAPEVDDVEVVLDDYVYSPATLEIGALRAVRATNLGGLEHTWSVLESPIETEVDLGQATVLIDARLDIGQATTVDVSSLEPGRYQVVCTIAGHMSQGMVGELVVGAG